MRISVVIPAYNAEPYTREAIESPFFHGYPPHEAIVIEDGSTDGAAGIAESGLITFLLARAMIVS